LILNPNLSTLNHEEEEEEEEEFNPRSSEVA